MSRKKIATVCLWLLFCGSVIGEEPCEAPTAGDYANASRELEEHPQGFIQILNRADTIGSRAFIARYEACMKQQEADLRRERLKAEAEVLRAETEAIKAETEALKADQRRKELEAQSEALKNVVRNFSTTNLNGDADYQIDLGLVLDFEDTRKLIDQCTDLGRLEVIRAPLESATDLEQLRATLEQFGIVEFHGCPSGVTGSGIVDLLGEASKPRTLNEDDFGFIPNPQSNPETAKPRIFTEEDFTDALLEKEPERIIDGELYDARARNRSQGSSWYRVKVEFDGDEIIIHFRLGGRVHLTLDDEEIADPSEIHARDRDRGNRWTIDIEGLAE